MGCGTGGGCSTCEVSEKRGSANSTVFDWLYHIDTPNNTGKHLLEVQFKGERKDFYRNTDEVNISIGDWVVVEGNTLGHDIGRVTMKGELVGLQIKRKNRNIEKNPIKKIYRIASEGDIERKEESRINEGKVLNQAKRIISDYKLEMKLTDVEFQADNKKATFYYTAEKRVDFRELIREFAKRFHVRIEMKQIGVRQEAAKIGGIGSCGRELCCSTWMTKFPSVSTTAVRYQQLSINPQKISGQCGRLKCCLNFELDSYVEALKDFPNTKIKLRSKQGDAKFVKLDVFKGRMFYFELNSFGEPIEMDVNAVKKIIALNKKGETPINFEKFIVENKKNPLEDVAGQEDINRFDKKK